MDHGESVPVKLYSAYLEGEDCLAVLAVVDGCQHLQVDMIEVRVLLNVYLLFQCFAQVVVQFLIDLWEGEFTLFETQYLLVLLRVVVFVTKILEEVVEVLLKLHHIFLEVLFCLPIQVTSYKTRVMWHVKVIVLEH